MVEFKQVELGAESIFSRMKEKLERAPALLNRCDDDSADYGVVTG